MYVHEKRLHQVVQRPTYVHVAGVVVNPDPYEAGGMNPIEPAGFFLNEASAHGMAWHGVGVGTGAGGGESSGDAYSSQGLG